MVEKLRRVDKKWRVNWGKSENMRRGEKDEIKKKEENERKNYDGDMR